MTWSKIPVLETTVAAANPDRGSTLYGRLAIEHIRLLKLTLSFYSGGVQLQLGKHMRLSIDAWTAESFGAEESLKAFVTAAPFPDGGHSMMTPERLGTVCETLYEVGRLISNTEGYFLDDGYVDPEQMEQKQVEVAEILGTRS